MSTDYEELGGNIIMSITEPSAASSLSNMGVKSAHGNLLHSHHAPQENGCH